MNNKCIKYLCNHGRFKGRLCKDHYDKYCQAKLEYRDVVNQLSTVKFLNRKGKVNEDRILA